MEKVDAIWHHRNMSGDGDKDGFPSDAADRFQVRMPPGMRDRLKAEAEANKRSMNAEIVARLDESFVTQQRLEAGIKGVSGLLTEIMARVARDMREEGKSPEEFLDWMRSFPAFAATLPPKVKIKDE